MEAEFDIKATAERLKFILERDRDVTDADGSELITIAIDSIADLLINARRIADALESINHNTMPRG